MNSFDAIHELPEKWIRIDVVDSGNSLTINCIDSGTGIPKSIIHKIMQPFFTTKDVGKGTGLGLSISKGLAESHGGTLEYDLNSVNTRFILQLPKSQVTQKIKSVS